MTRFHITDDVDDLNDSSPHLRDPEAVEWIEDRPPFQRAMKRLMDIVGASVALILFGPILVVIAIAIKLTSKGPVFLSQHRIGYHGKVFRFFKFRSMYIDAGSRLQKEFVQNLISEKFGKMGDEGTFKIKNDPRITPIGSFLRKTSLDELPQFFNVLAGTMSLVGPRPALTYEWQAYADWHRQRVSCKPGITGLWQITGRSRLTFDEMVKIDLEYASRQSPLLDLKVLLKTPLVVLSGNGSY
jgi:lipopolysaccharide/colanic/teichoic acid biosynthesis glycosyltransferase